MASTSMRNPDMFASSTDAIRHITPERSPTKKAMGITQAQKQALIDNLQLEITERARRLRAQYATQAAQLRSRLEMRVNRIPQALRKRKLQDLMDEHIAKTKPAPPPPTAMRITTNTIKKPVPGPSVQDAPAVAKHANKRKSDEISTGDDKENNPSNDSGPVANPKKRTKATPATANSKATRTVSRKAQPTGVLSPKSHNSRTLPRSPLKAIAASPEKSHVPRPASTKSRTKPQPDRAPSRQVGNSDTATDSEGRTSEASNTSAGTTIIRRPGTKTAAAVKKPAPAKAAPVVRKTTAANSNTVRKTTAPVTIASGRTLRKRN